MPMTFYYSYIPMDFPSAYPKDYTGSRIMRIGERYA